MIFERSEFGLCNPFIRIVSFLFFWFLLLSVETVAVFGPSHWLSRLLFDLQCKNFAVGAFRKEKKEQTFELARKRVSLDSDINRLQQKVRRLESKVGFFVYHRAADTTVDNTALMAVFYFLYFFFRDSSLVHRFSYENYYMLLVALRSYILI